MYGIYDKCCWRLLIAFPIQTDKDNYDDSIKEDVFQGLRADLDGYVGSSRIHAQMIFTSVPGLGLQNCLLYF